MSEPKSTEQFVNGVRVVTTEVETDDGVVATHEGLVEAVEAEWRGLTPDQLRERLAARYRSLVRDHIALVEQFVN
jgi:hypothetical protein